MQWIITRKKEAFVQRVVFKGVIGKNKQGTKKSSNRFEKVKLKFNRRLNIE